MTTLFKEFDQVKSKYDERIEELRQEVIHNEIALEELHSDREAALRNVMKDIDTEGLDSRIEASSKRVDVLEARIAYAQQEQRTQLAALLDYVADTREKAAKKKEKEYNEALLKLQRMKLDYLAAAEKLGELNREFDDINKAANACRLEAGAEPVRFSPINDLMSLNAHPSFNGFEDASWRTLVIPEWLYIEAQRGNFPKWKEVLMNEN